MMKTALGVLAVIIVVGVGVYLSRHNAPVSITIDPIPDTAVLGTPSTDGIDGDFDVSVAGSISPSTKSEQITVVAVLADYSGSMDWPIISELVSTTTAHTHDSSLNSPYAAYATKAVAQNGRWSATLTGIGNGTYYLLVYDTSRASPVASTTIGVGGYHY